MITGSDLMPCRIDDGETEVSDLPDLTDEQKHWVVDEYMPEWQDHWPDFLTAFEQCYDINPHDIEALMWEAHRHAQMDQSRAEMMRSTLRGIARPDRLGIAATFMAKRQAD